MNGSQVAILNNRCFQLNAALKIPSAKILPVDEMFGRDGAPKEEFASCQNVTYSIYRGALRTNLFNVCEFNNFM